jgi:hypothetical protein
MAGFCCAVIVADGSERNAHAHNDCVSRNGRRPNADHRRSGDGPHVAAVAFLPSAVVAYTLAEEEPPTFAAGVAVVRFAAARTRPSR